MASSPGNVLLHRRFPVPPVERFWRDRCKVDIIETADVHVDLVRVGTRDVEGMDAAGSTELVLGGARVEFVSGEVFFPRNKVKSSGGTIRCKKPFLVHTEQL